MSSSLEALSLSASRLKTWAVRDEIVGPVSNSEGTVGPARGRIQGSLEDGS